MIVGTGIDVVSIPRFADALRRWPRLGDRLFTERERRTTTGHERSAASLAARFAAKEAVAKALGAPTGLAWHDCEILSAVTGRPTIEATGSVAAAALALGILNWHLTMSHDADVAIAQVIAEGGSA